MSTIFYFLIVLGILIFVHELGHFAVAKYFGVGVEKFSLGFGPPIFKYKYGETEYMISVIPLGGYVKMTGENQENKEVVEDYKPIDPAKSFMLKPVYQRIAIALAGPLMNFILALSIYPIIFMLGIPEPAFLSKPAEIGFVFPGGAGDKSGIKKGDVITEIEGVKINSWQNMMVNIALYPEKPLKVKLTRNGAEQEIVLTPAATADMGVGAADIAPIIPPVAHAIRSKSPAEVSGLKAGDTVTSIAGKEITHWYELLLALKDVKEKDKPVNISYIRDGKTYKTSIVPEYMEAQKRYVIGIEQKQETVVKKYGFTDSISRGLDKLYDITVLMFKFLKGLFTGAYSVKSLGGPILIAQVTADAAETGFTSFLDTLALVSLNLAIINLFPIPILDGGLIVFFLIEGLRGKPLSEKIIGYSQQAGFALIIALMVLATWNDIWRLFG